LQQVVHFVFRNITDAYTPSNNHKMKILIHLFAAVQGIDQKQLFAVSKFLISFS